MNLSIRELARRLGVILKGDESKREIERLIAESKSSGAVKGFPYPVPAPHLRPLVGSNRWTVGHDPRRKHGTFNIGQLFSKVPAHGKENGITLFSDLWDFIREMNKYNRGNWIGKLVNESNAEYWISRLGGADSGKPLYIPAPSCFMNNQVKVLGEVGNYYSIEAINIYNLPDPDDVRENPAVVHIYNGWAGGEKYVYFDYPIYVPVWMPFGRAYIEKQLVK